MDTFKSTLLSTAEEMELEVTEEQAQQCVAYAKLLLEVNEHTNLTRITEPAEMAVKHFVDSATVLRYDLIDDKTRLIDVGTGAGFPGLVLKILRPDLEVILLDSVGKRVRFLKDVIDQLGLDDVRAIHARAEDAGRDVALREQCDVAVARAVSQMPVLAEYLLPFVKVGGRIIAWKGPDIQSEIESSKRAFRILGAGSANVLEFALPSDAGGRSLVTVEKLKPTPKTYPRKAGDPTRRPLL